MGPGSMSPNPVEAYGEREAPMTRDELDSTIDIVSRIEDALAKPAPSPVRCPKCHQLTPGLECEECEVFRCGGCERWFSWEHGGADSGPDLCDDCWVRAHREAALARAYAASTPGPTRLVRRFAGAKCENCAGLNCPAADGSGPCQNPNGIDDDPAGDDR